MVGPQRGIGRTSRQANGTAAEICDIGIPVISLDNSTNVSDVVGEARQDEIGVVVCASCAAASPVPSGCRGRQGSRAGLFDVVIQGVAVADALQCEPGCIGEKFSQAGMGGAKPAPGFRSQKRSQSFRHQFRDCDHLNLHIGMRGREQSIGDDSTLSLIWRVPASRGSVAGWLCATPPCRAQKVKIKIICR